MLIFYKIHPKLIINEDTTLIKTTTHNNKSEQLFFSFKSEFQLL